MTLVDFVSEKDLRLARESLKTLSHPKIYQKSQLKQKELFSIANMNENLDTIETHRKLGLATMSQIFKDDQGQFVKVYENPSYAFCEVIASVILRASNLDVDYKMDYRLATVRMNGKNKFCSTSDYFPRTLKSLTQWLLECYQYKDIRYNSLDYDAIEFEPKRVTPSGFVEDVIFLFYKKDNMKELLQSIYMFFDEQDIELSVYDREVLRNYVREYAVCRKFDAYVLNTDRSKNNLGLFGGESAPLFDLGMSFNKFYGYKLQNNLNTVSPEHYSLISCNHKLSDTRMQIEESICFSKIIIDELLSKLRALHLVDLGGFIDYSLRR